METAYIHWNVDPEIFNLFGIISIRYYSLMFFFGLLSGYLIVKNFLVEDKISVELIDKLALYIFLGTFLGARLGHCLFYEPGYFLSHPLEILLPFRHIPGGGFHFTGFQGLASHGGGAGVLIAIYMFCKKNKIVFMWIVERVAIAVPLVGGFIRLGNFFNSEILGEPTNSNLGFIFTRVDNIPRHPAQLYEAVLYFIIFGILYFLYLHHRKNKKPETSKSEGYFFGVFLTLIFSVRIFVEFFKENQVSFENGLFLNMGQLLSLPFIIIGVFLIIKKYR